MKAEIQHFTNLTPGGPREDLESRYFSFCNFSFTSCEPRARRGLLDCRIVRFCFSFSFPFFFFTEAPTITDETDAVISSVYAKFHGEPVTASQGTKQYSVPTTAGVDGSSTRQCAIVSLCFSFPWHSFEIPPTIFPTIPVLYPPIALSTVTTISLPATLFDGSQG